MKEFERGMGLPNESTFDEEGNLVHATESGEVKTTREMEAAAEKAGAKAAESGGDASAATEAHREEHIRGSKTNREREEGITGKEITLAELEAFERGNREEKDTKE
jgi:hypothetical protein